MDSENSQSPGTPSDRRRYPRFKPKNVHSLLGEVVDLSVDGMRVLHRGRSAVEAGETFDMLLQHGEEDMAVSVRVVRVERMGDGREAIALEITDPSPQVQQQILAMQPGPASARDPAPQAFLRR
ncbi:MAG: PilZ domain-containing protein [Phycisphaeraceae bacterium]